MSPFATPRSAVWPAVPGLPELWPGDRVHLVGVGGAGMSGLARALVELGLEVSGSDRQDSAMLRALASERVVTSIGHAPENLPPDCKLVVRTPAVPDDNPELAGARAAGVPITKRALLLGALMDSREGIAVAGTHGKTTTSGLIAAILDAAALEPGFFIGGELPDLGSNARLGSGRYLVIEADEYDRSFLHGHPQLAVITNLEHDHPDIYPELEALTEAFAAFAARIAPAPSGLLLVNAAWPLALASAAASPARLARYHVEGDPLADSTQRIDWQAVDLQPGHDGTRFELRRNGRAAGRFHIGLPGRHNVSNALAALAIAFEIGIEPEISAAVLAGYRGAGRRFDLLGEIGGKTLIDDYAHHPTEIRATLSAARERFAGRRILAVVEPHTFSRVTLLRDAFREALTLADHCIVTPIYAAREAAVEGIDADWLCRGLEGVEAADSLDAAAERCIALAREGDLLLFMGAGRITQVSRSCLAGLRAREIAELLSEARAAGLSGEIEPGRPLSEHTTLRVGGPAELLVRLRELDSLGAWWAMARRRQIPVRVLGRGSNILVADAGLPGLVLVNRCEGWQLSPDAADPNRALVRAESGLTLAALAQSLARQGWCGLEMSVGIPGSVGAAVVTNAGAHGWEMVDSLVEVEGLGPDGAPLRLLPEDLAFRYRGCRLKDSADHLLLAVSLRVKRDDPEAILARIARFSQHRRETQPRDPSVGSIFKNPPGDFAGRLIEASGLKGQQVGGARVSPIHANFFVNAGKARAADLLALIELARRKVEQDHGASLETEIEILGASDVR